MLNKFVSVVIVAALICTFTAPPALAGNPSKAVVRTGETLARSDSGTEAAKANDEKLKTEIQKLVADARAGSNGVTLPRPQVQSPHRNNLSTGAKVAIGVGIGVAIVVLILVSTRCNNEPGSC